MELANEGARVHLKLLCRRDDALHGRLARADLEVTRQHPVGGQSAGVSLDALCFTNEKIFIHAQTARIQMAEHEMGNLVQQSEHEAVHPVTPVERPMTGRPSSSLKTMPSILLDFSGSSTIRTTPTSARISCRSPRLLGLRRRLTRSRAADARESLSNGSVERLSQIADAGNPCRLLRTEVWRQVSSPGGGQKRGALVWGSGAEEVAYSTFESVIVLQPSGLLQFPHWNHTNEARPFAQRPLKGT